MIALLAFVTVILGPPGVPGPPAEPGPPAIPATTAEQALRQYPQAAIDRGQQGTALTAFDFDAKGQAQNCRILRSAGSAELDQAACVALADAPPLERSTDAAGKPRASGSRQVHFILVDEPPSLRMPPGEDDDIFVVRERRPLPNKRLAPVGPPNRPAKPVGNLSPFTSDDYPRGAVNAGDQGIVGIYFRIGQEGRITACRVLQSSGWSALDKTSCAIFTQRVVFETATDAEGRPIKSFWRRDIHWSAPRY